MSRVIQARHLAPVRGIPKGLRKEVLAFPRIVTPVEVREVDRAEMAEVARIPMRNDVPMEFFAHGGRLWHRLRGAPNEFARDRFPPEDFVALLEGQKAFITFYRSDLVRVFERNPFMGIDEAGTPVNATLSVNEPDIAKMVEDGTEQVRTDLRRFLDEEVRFAGGDVFLRWLGPVAMPTFQGTLHVEGEREGLGPQILLFPRVSVRWGLSGCDFPCRADRLGDYRFLAGPVLAPEDDRRFVMPDLAKVFPAELIQDDDLLLFANHVLPEIHQDVVEVEAKLRDRQAAAALRELWRPMRPWLTRSLYGGIGPADVEECLAALAPVAGALRDGGFPLGKLAGAASSYIDRLALPRLREQRPLDEGDLDAFTGLGPGGP